MRKLVLALMALACLIGAAGAQQQQKFTADQGAPGAAPWPVSWSGQSVLADLRIGGAAVAPSNPVPILSPNTASSGTVALGATTNTLVIPVPDGASTMSLNLSGVTGSGATLAVQISADGTNFASVAPLFARQGTGQTPSGITADNPNARFLQVAGLRAVRVAVTTAGTGTATATYTFSSAPIVPGTLSTSSGPGGLALFSRLPSSAAGTNLTQISTTPRRVYKIIACHTTTTAARIKLFDSTAPTVGATAPLFSRPIPPAAAAGGLACVSYDAADLGWTFTTGVAFALVTGAADSDATAVAAGAITDVSVEYQ